MSSAFLGSLYDEEIYWLINKPNSSLKFHNISFSFSRVLENHKKVVI